MIDHRAYECERRVDYAEQWHRPRPSPIREHLAAALALLVTAIGVALWIAVMARAASLLGR